MPKWLVDRDRWLVRGRVALVGICLGLLLVPFVETDRELMNSDLTGIGSIGLLAAKDPKHMYDRVAMRQEQSRLTDGGRASQAGQSDGLLPSVSPPWVGFMAVPFLALGRGAGGRLWATLELLALGLGFALMVGRRRLWDVVPAVAGVPTALMVANLQVDGIVVLGMGGAYALNRRGRPLLAGMALGLTLAKPHLVVALAIGLLVARRWRVIAGWTLAAVSLIAGTVLVEPTIPVQWVEFILHNARRIGNDISLPGLVGQSLLIPAATLALGIVLYAAWRRRHDEAVAAGILVAGGLLCAPHALATDTLMIGAGLLLAGNPGWREWLLLSVAAAVLALNHEPFLTALLGVATILGFVVRLSLPGWPPRPEAAPSRAQGSLGGLRTAPSVAGGPSGGSV